MDEIVSLRQRTAHMSLRIETKDIVEQGILYLKNVKTRHKRASKIHKTIIRYQ